MSNKSYVNVIIISDLHVIFLVYRIPRTTLRINKVQIVGEINKPPTVTGLETAVL